MKQLCIKTCQVIIDGQITLCQRGLIYNVEKEHPRFTPLAQHKVNFLKDSRESLQDSKWKFSEAKAAIEGEYGVQLFKEEGTKKSEIIEQILDARYRNVELVTASTT